jgi:hypothetical protein
VDAADAHGQTAPRVTARSKSAASSSGGVKFHMGGTTLRVEVVGPSGADVAVFQCVMARHGPALAPAGRRARVIGCDPAIRGWCTWRRD